MFAVPAWVFSVVCFSTSGRCMIFGYVNVPELNGTCRPDAATGRDRLMMSMICAMCDGGTRPAMFDVSVLMTARCNLSCACARTRLASPPAAARVATIG